MTEEETSPDHQQWAQQRLSPLESLSLPWDAAGFRQQLLAVICLSDYALELIRQHPDWVAEDWHSGVLQAATGSPVVMPPELSGEAGEEALMAALRAHRHRLLLRILWRDINSIDPLDQTLKWLSEVADGLIQAALERAEVIVQAQHGTPRDSEGRRQQLVVVGMGKLGGRELNFSSDIDLIFAFPSAGETDGPRCISNEEYFARLARLLVRWLNQRTADGFVYRVDLRLRPFGDAGRLALSFNAMEQYYQREGRDWERYAWVKARPVAGDLEAGEELLGLMRPFVYRRYLDYSAFEALREMKGMIAGEVERRQLRDDIKLGSGGIREIEFVAQAFQLIRGGREPVLRDRSLRVILGRLASMGLLETRSAEQLDQAYCFLRVLENRLQQVGDAQVHRLPQEWQIQWRLACSMQFPDWESLSARLQQCRAAVSDCFQGVFEPDHGQETSPSNADRWVQAWDCAQDQAVVEQLLAGSEFSDSKSIATALKGLRSGVTYRSLGKRTRQRLDRLIPALLAGAAADSRPDRAFLNTLKVVRAVLARSAYIAMMAERPVVLERLVDLCSDSSWLTEMVARQPLLLDELIDARLIGGLPDRRQVVETIERRLSVVEAGDLEAEMEALRLSKQGLTMGVAVSALDGSTSSSPIARALVQLAEEILQVSCELAWRDIASRHGLPSGDQPGLAVIGYGTLGGRELNFTSDLDLVFLHHGASESGMTSGQRPIANLQFFLRVAQRILHLLTTLTAAGRLYEVDARLRPEGKSGFLVSSLEAYGSYQRKKAWTWELQALTRARWVAGDASLKAGFEQVRQQALAVPRNVEQLAEEVCSMRSRMRQELDRGKGGRFDMKQGSGGKVDIEFLAQWAVLRWASEHPELLNETGTLEILDRCSSLGLIAAETAEQLADGYRAYRSRYQKQALQERSGVLRGDEFANQRARIEQIWQQLLDC